jgi:hypothetical protein
MNDYLSNPKCDKWNDPFSEYQVSAVYEWRHVATGKTGTREIRVKESKHADVIINYWNSVQNEWTYRRLE